MIINRVWEMPNKYTFKMKCVQELLSKYVTCAGIGWIDPFSGMHSPAQFTNDINVDTPAQSHEDALTFLKFHAAYVANSKVKYNGCLFDPPYSEAQCMRLYKQKKDTHAGRAGRAEYIGACKDEISLALGSGSIAISFGWDTCGIGKKRGFEIIEVLDICHGACHNDTLVTVERKIEHRAEEQGKEGEVRV